MNNTYWAGFVKTRPHGSLIIFYQHQYDSNTTIFRGLADLFEIIQAGQLVPEVPFNKKWKCKQTQSEAEERPAEKNISQAGDKNTFYVILNTSVIR